MGSPLGADSAPCVTDASVGTYSYVQANFKVAVTGAYGFSDRFPGAVDVQDGRIGVYGAAFNPADPGTGCLAFFDDNSGGSVQVDLVAGTVYALVGSSAASAAAGQFAFDVFGPGAFTVLAPTTTTVSTGPNPSRLSKKVTLRAVVRGGSPTGLVQFSDGTRVLGNAALSSGVATRSFRTLALGHHAIRATYLGDGAHEQSTAIASHRVVHGPKPKVKLKASAKQVNVGDKVRLTWSTKHASTITATGAWKGKRSKKGSKRVRVRDLGAHIYKLKVTNVDGVARARVKVIAVRGPKELKVAIDEPIVLAGTDVEVTAGNLDRKERFKVFLGDDLLFKGFASKRGTVAKDITIPTGTKEGEYALRVVGSNAARVGEVPIAVIVARTLDVTVKKPVVRPGRKQVVSVTGLAAGESVAVFYKGSIITEGTADDDGNFEYRFGVGDTPGSQVVRVFGQVPKRVGEAGFSVDGRPAGDGG